MDQKTKKKLFISGPVSGRAYYWKDFEDARKYYTERGFAVMIPSELPVGMLFADYARVCLAMIDSADEVAFLPGWEESAGARLEMEYCCYTGKVTRMYADDVGPKEYRCDLEEFDATEETPYDERCFAMLSAIEKAIADGYQIDLSLDENGWLSAGLYPPKEGSK